VGYIVGLAKNERLNALFGRVGVGRSSKLQSEPVSSALLELLRYCLERLSARLAGPKLTADLRH
jgi:hypothetical protein